MTVAGGQRAASPCINSNKRGSWPTGHLVRTFGRNRAGEDAFFGMTSGDRRATAGPCPSMASAKDFRPKKSAACPRTDGRCARSLEEATADRPCHAQAFYNNRLTCQASIAMASHETAASPRAQPGDCTIINQITRPKAASPKLPSAAPTASSAAASLPRRAPGRPAFSLRSRTCFSINVALAGKMRERRETGHQ
jgi:hypothetical protein